MTVKAKFTCNSLVPTQYNPANIIAYFNAVYGTEGENADYSKATPYGQLTLGIDAGTAAATYFEVGKNYYLTFETVGE